MKGAFVYNPNGGTINGSPAPTTKGKPYKSTKSGAPRSPGRKGKQGETDERMAKAAAALQEWLK